MKKIEAKEEEQKNGFYLDEQGNEYWYKNNKFHNEDEPAIELVNGSKYWYKNGKLHREDGPAIEKSDGTKKYYRNGLKCNEDGYYVVITKGKI